MLKYFFKLNEPYKVFHISSDLFEHFEKSKDLRNVLYRPDKLIADDIHYIFQNNSFVNVSFSKTVINGFTFRNCEFEDCLFIGTKFINCNFHNCRFKNCNPYKVKFVICYIDPLVFKSMFEIKKYSNIGMHIFHELFLNSNKIGRLDFKASAEYYFRKYRRYQFRYDYKQNYINKFNFIKKWLPESLFEVFAGYGLRATPVLIWSLTLFIVMTSINYFFWENFTLSDSSLAVQKPNIILAIYYTIITITTLGYGDIIPSSKLGMILASAESIIGLFLLSMFATLIIRKIIR